MTRPKIGSETLKTLFSFYFNWAIWHQYLSSFYHYDNSFWMITALEDQPRDVLHRPVSCFCSTPCLNVVKSEDYADLAWKTLNSTQENYKLAPVVQTSKSHTHTSKYHTTYLLSEHSYSLLNYLGVDRFTWHMSGHLKT